MIVQTHFVEVNVTSNASFIRYLKLEMKSRKPGRHSSTLFLIRFIGLCNVRNIVGAVEVGKEKSAIKTHLFYFLVLLLKTCTFLYFKR